MEEPLTLSSIIPFPKFPKSSKMSKRGFASSSEQVPSNNRVPPTIFSPSLFFFCDLPMESLHHATRVVSSSWWSLSPQWCPHCPAESLLWASRETSLALAQSCVSCHLCCQDLQGELAFPATQRGFLFASFSKFQTMVHRGC